MNGIPQFLFMAGFATAILSLAVLARRIVSARWKNRVATIYLIVGSVAFVAGYTLAYTR